MKFILPAKALWTCIICVLSCSIASAAIPVNPTPNFSINYRVHVPLADPLTPKIEVQLRGVDEVTCITSFLEAGRYHHFSGDGKISQLGTDVQWWPMALNAALNYDVTIPHESKKGIFDSYGKKDWVITRTADLFPRKLIQYSKVAKSYTTVTFELPTGWDVVTEMPKVGDHVFRAFPELGDVYDRPTGWLIYGKVHTTVISAKDVKITLAYPESFLRPPSGKNPAKDLLQQKYLDWFQKKITEAVSIYQQVIPIMTTFLPKYAKEFLVIMGKNPMWHGGLSGEHSLYIHRGVPNIAKDNTSTLVHEYFHVCSGFNKDPRDAEWFVEGLAEFFSIRMLYEAKFLTQEQYFAGIQTLNSQSEWGTNLTKSHKNIVFYKNAPVVLFTLDEMIRAKFAGEKSLKDVMPLLAEEDRRINTTIFEEKIESVYGESLKAFFNAYVVGGKVPEYQHYISSP